MHDSSTLDSLGIPALVVATTAFVEAADVQAKALGYDPTIVWVPHPVQDRTDAELHEMAEKSVDEILARLTARD